MPARLCYDFDGNLESSKLREQQWLKNALELLESAMTCASFHASLQAEMHDPPAITGSFATLP